MLFLRFKFDSNLTQIKAIEFKGEKWIILLIGSNLNQYIYSNYNIKEFVWAIKKIRLDLA